MIGRFFSKNIHIFVPLLLFIISFPLIFGLLYSPIEKLTLDTSSYCDYSNGGGSRNLCSNTTDIYTLVASVIVSFIVVPAAFDSIAFHLGKSYKSAFNAVKLLVISIFMLVVIAWLFMTVQNYFLFTVGFIVSLAIIGTMWIKELMGNYKS